MRRLMQVLMAVMWATVTFGSFVTMAATVGAI